VIFFGGLYMGVKVGDLSELPMFYTGGYGQCIPAVGPAELYQWLKTNYK